MIQAPAKLDTARLAERAKKDLYFFAKGILGYDWLNPRIHLPLCQFLMDTKLKRKKVVFPRGWLKTTVCSIAFPMWWSINDPNVRCLIVQNSATNAQKKLSVIGDQWEQNSMLRALFPDLVPSKSCTWTADSKCITRSESHPESTYEAAGTSTRVVSRHYNLIIEDDTVAPDYDEFGGESLAPTNDDVQKAIGWHKTNVLPLMTNPATDVSLVVGTRWYDRDLLAWIDENEPSYKNISRACRENTLGESDEKGDITYPERFDAEVLSQLEHALGPYMFSCLYMNKPIRSEDMLFKTEWFKFYDQHPRHNELAIYTTVDVATDPELAKTEDIDFSTVMTCAKDMRTGEIFVLDYFRERCNPGTHAKAIFDHVVRFNPMVVGYENVAYQRSLEYWLKELMKEYQVYFILEQIPRQGRDAKEMAIRALQPLFAAGVIFFKNHMRELQSELLKFPLGSHDDLADTLSMQLQLWRRTRSKSQQRLEQNGEDLTFNSAVEELKARAISQNVRSSLIFDPMRSYRDAVPRMVS